jgi:hypothetical protein
MRKEGPPSSLRRAYGYREARASGVTGFQESRSVNQIQKDIKESEATRQLNDEVKSDPEWGPFVKHWIIAKLRPSEIVQSLENAKFDVWLRRKGMHATRKRYAKF